MEVHLMMSVGLICAIELCDCIDRAVCDGVQKWSQPTQRKNKMNIFHPLYRLCVCVVGVLPQCLERFNLYN